MTMTKQKIAIACQGGGSQTAFTAGVLSSLLKQKVHEKKEIVGLSGTSGGAVCAALAWYGLLKTASGDTTPVEQRLNEFWEDNATQNIFEGYLNHALIQYIKLVNGGLIPQWETSPYSPMHQVMATAFEWLMPQFYDFKGLLEKRIQFEEIPELINPSNSPILLIGAADVLNGKFTIFNSHDKKGIKVDMILASAAVPSISKAVEIDKRAYWDGLFSDNPPTDELVNHDQVGEHRLPDQIWVIQINPNERKTIPQTTEEIIDRRNEMIGNESLLHDLNHICRINNMIRRDAFKAGYQKEHHLKLVDIYIIQMSPSLQERLDYASKLDRNKRYIEMLMADGERQGRAFWENPESMRYGDEDC